MKPYVIVRAEGSVATPEEREALDAKWAEYLAHVQDMDVKNPPRQPSPDFVAAKKGACAPINFDAIESSLETDGD